jgi:hypothetical protein
VVSAVTPLRGMIRRLLLTAEALSLVIEQTTMTRMTTPLSESNIMTLST